MDKAGIETHDLEPSKAREDHRSVSHQHAGAADPQNEGHFAQAWTLGSDEQSLRVIEGSLNLDRALALSLPSLSYRRCRLRR